MMRSTVAFVLGIGAIGALVECSPFGGGGDFTCDGDQSCTGGTGGRCEPSGFCSFADPACTDGHRYGDGPNAGQCVGGEQIDAGVTVDALLPPDAAVLIDSSVDAAPVLYCVGAFVQVCLPAKPSSDLSLPAAIDTGAAPCRTDVTDKTGVALKDYCVVAGANVSANSAVYGNRPLIVIATNKLTVGTLDVSSHRGIPLLGPGADYASCGNGIGLDGTNGGGGGGGSFGGNGGNGGNHNTDKGGLGGKKALANVLRGGCAGGNGSTANKVGHGGGAVLLIAAGTIEIDGALNASGSGADTAGNTKEYGGSGGGSGGLIVLEAQQISNTGVVIANGGGGASGSSSGGLASVAGNDPSPTSTAAASGGKPASQNGGTGGDGGATTKLDGSDGQDGQPFMTTMFGGGGGGGGGGGAILTHTGTLTGNVSPAAQTF